MFQLWNDSILYLTKIYDGMCKKETWRDSSWRLNMKNYACCYIVFRGLDARLPKNKPRTRSILQEMAFLPKWSSFQIKYLHLVGHRVRRLGYLTCVQPTLLNPWHHMWFLNPTRSNPWALLGVALVYTLFISFSPFLIMEWIKIKWKKDSFTASAARQLRKINENIHPCLNVSHWRTRLATISNPNLLHCNSWLNLIFFSGAWSDIKKKILFQPLSKYWIVETVVIIIPA